jgi:hypothetical protein
MDERHLLAYALIALMVLTAGIIIAYYQYNTHQRSDRRRRARQNAAHEKLMSDRE